MGGFYGFSTFDVHDAEWEHVDTGRTVATSDDEQFCSGCGEYVYDDDGDGACDDCGTKLGGAR